MDIGAVEMLARLEEEPQKLLSLSIGTVIFHGFRLLILTLVPIIYDSGDAITIHMGLTNWKQAPDGKILKSDVYIAKNYLSDFDKEIQHITGIKDDKK